MRAIVTGGTGFIGRSLVKRLQRDDWEIKVITRQKGKVKKILGEGVEEIVWSDLGEFPEADVVFNIAGAIKGKNYEDFRRANVDFIRNIIERSEGRVEKIVHLSSQAAGGPSPDCKPLDESASSPVSLYGRSKLEGENVVKEFSGDWVILRPSAVFGPGDMAFLELFRVIKRGFVPWMGDKILSMVYVEDLTEAMLNSVDKVSRDVFNISWLEPVNYREFTEKVAEMMGKKAPKRLPIPYPVAVVAAFISQTFSPDSMFNLDKIREARHKCWIVNSEKAHRAGLLEDTPLDDALRITMDWYRTNGYI